MTEVVDTQVTNEPGSTEGETLNETQEGKASGETRTPEQQDQSVAYWQSQSDVQKNENERLSTELERMKYLEVLETQLKTDPSFQTDLAGHYNLINQGDANAMNTESDYNPGDYMLAGDVAKMVKDGVQKALSPMMNGLNILAETNKAKDLGLDVSQQDIQLAMANPVQGAERIHYEQLKATATAASADTLANVNKQVTNENKITQSLAGAGSAIVEPREEEKTPN